MRICTPGCSRLHKSCCLWTKETHAKWLASQLQVTRKATWQFTQWDSTQVIWDASWVSSAIDYQRHIRALATNSQAYLKICKSSLSERHACGCQVWVELYCSCFNRIPSYVATLPASICLHLHVTDTLIMMPYKLIRLTPQYHAFT